MGYWNKDILGFEPYQNEKGTLIEYTQEEQDEILERAKGGKLRADENGKPVVAPRPQPTAAERQALYESRVDSLIRERYTLSQELAIIRQQESKSDEYQAYFDYCEECKTKAKQEVYGNEV